MPLGRWVLRYAKHPLGAFPCGLETDPISSLSLSTTWPPFREDAVLHNARYSELDPFNAPTWTLRCQCQAIPPVGKLTTLINEFSSLKASPLGWAEVYDLPFYHVGRCGGASSTR